MRILSLDGGGYLGLASAAFLAELERRFQTRCHDRFDLFCGTSTGAIIALALASGMSAAEVVNLYKSFGPQVFRNRFPGARHLRFLQSFFLAKYSNRTLRSSFADAFGDLTLGDIQAKGKSVLITTMSVTQGKPYIFKTDHGEGLCRDNKCLVRDVALASAAAPSYLPIVELKSPATGVSEKFCDGGVVANHPALLGYAEAIYHLKANPNDVQILSISTPRASLAEPASAKKWLPALLSRGIIGWAPKLSGILIDMNSAITHEALRRIVETRGAGSSAYRRVDFPKPEGVEMDIANSRATETLISSGGQKASEEGTRRDVELFFKDKV